MSNKAVLTAVVNGWGPQTQTRNLSCDEFGRRVRRRSAETRPRNPDQDLSAADNMCVVVKL